ncbi:hypothetical protein [Psychrobacter sp. SWN149]|uniref:hypothetical protein n=1 Tax=Psychrobacter sp. SWN149 TaxID=2792057 RepID=UPI0018CEAFD2|nr:hypothetical protein [Psychrobacter sp. SWN149]MBH0007293.1 hypothetical protein [Psychrobacter sp. SWN149]
MEDTMSSYSFSHQFYQRWTCAPEPVRAAITQELKDITTLLQADTVFESFTFNTHDLDAHVDELYDNYNAEQAIAKAITDKQEQVEAEKQRLEEAQQKEAEADQRKDAAAQKEKEENEQRAIEKNNADKDSAATEADKASSHKGIANITITRNTGKSIEKTASNTISSESNISNNSISSVKNENTDSNTLSEKIHVLSDEPIEDINNKAGTAIKLALKDTQLDATHEQLIRELETQVDDYLSEQMMLMSENLKSWLRAEVTQHFSEQSDSTTNNEAVKKNIH